MTTKLHPLTGEISPVHFRDPACFPLFARLNSLIADTALPAYLAVQIKEAYRSLKMFDGVSHGWMVIKSAGVSLDDLDCRIAGLEQAAHIARFGETVH